MYISAEGRALFEAGPIPEAEQCINFGGQRYDGSKCQDRAEPDSGWCASCKAEFTPEPR